MAMISKLFSESDGLLDVDSSSDCEDWGSGDVDREVEGESRVASRSLCFRLGGSCTSRIFLDSPGRLVSFLYRRVFRNS